MADTAIKNLESYLRSMSSTLIDKCWWLDKITPEIDTIIDFGCAGADLAIFVDRIFPGKYLYIGVDESPEMIKVAENNLKAHYSGKWYVVSDIAEASRKVGFRNAVLVLNSVLHEVFSYKSEREIWRLMFQIQDIGFKYIAIRDMQYYRCKPDDLNTAAYAISQSNDCDLWKQHHHIHATYNASGESDTELQEFLLKYRYKENWERESRETYVWDIFLSTEKYGIDDAYDTVFTQNFYIPFIHDKIKEDFGFDWDYPTHIKMLLKRKSEV